MVHTMVAGTDAGICVLFDPAAVTHLHSKTWNEFWEHGGDREAESGNLVLVEVPSDGEYKFQAYIEEPAPEAVLKRAFHKEHGRLLRVPSGRLCSSGMEHLPLRDARTAGKSGTEVSVTSGDYALDVYLIEPDENDARMSGVDKVTGLGCLATVILLPIALLFLSTNDWSFQPPSAVIAAVLFIFWLPVLVWHRLPSVRAAKRQLSDEFTPSLILVMNRLDGDADRTGMKGALLRPPAVLEAKRLASAKATTHFQT